MLEAVGRPDAGETAQVSTMRESQFLTTAEVDRFLAFVPPPLRDIALELRNVVASACPSATERILWGGLSYYDSRKGGPVKGAICQIEVERDHVRLAFIHGARLADPSSLLRGDRLSKRYAMIKSYEDTRWEELRQLIDEAARLDPSKFGPLSHSQGRR
jgi:hypothetical protein